MLEMRFQEDLSYWPPDGHVYSDLVTTEKKPSNQQSPYHVLVVIAIFFRHTRVGVTVPYRELHCAAESTGDCGGEKKPVSDATSSAPALAPQKESRKTTQKSTAVRSRQPELPGAAW